MSSVIYYFSGTGNSLAVARDISAKMGGELIAIASVVDQGGVGTAADVIGIVFPVYHQGVPAIVHRFVDQTGNLEGKYVFGICTHGDSPGISLEYLNRMLQLKGGRLAAGFAVHMPYNYIVPSLTLKDFFGSFVLREVAEAEQRRIFAEWEKRREDVCGLITSRNENAFETKAKTIEHLVDFFNLRETLQKKSWLKIAGFDGRTDLSFRESLRLMDHGFASNAGCRGCGTCSKVCPVGNIELVDAKPKWRHRCEQCFACLQWCPNEAVQFRDGTSGRKRYHHPDVQLSDMLHAIA